MALIVKFLGQPYPGREITFDEAKTEVKFGRGVDCDVGFPEDMAIVSRSHFGLKRELDGYKFMINREKPVFMNGRPVYDDQDLPKTAEIQLSGPTGPKLRLERTDGGPSNQIKTEILKPQKDMSEVVNATSAKGNRTARLLAGVAAALIVLGGGGYFIAQKLQTDVTGLQEQVASITTEIPQIKQQVASAGASTANLSAIIEKNKESVYLVSIQLPSGTRMSMGTASVVALPDGTKALATNSHVADLFNEIAHEPRFSGAKLVVTQPRSPEYQTLEITRVQKHPGYDEFNKWQEQYWVKAQTLSAERMEFVPAFDVALMYVADPTQLGAPLTYAKRDEMVGMKAGEQLVLIGYPSEQLNGTSSQKPEPTSQTGIITSVTTFFLSRAEAESDMLIQHSVPATGGASGSPMFNTKGEVVAFLNAGNIVLVKNENGETMRIPSSALVNYAQRADLLIELAEGKAAERMPAYLKQMADADAELTKTPEVFIKDLVQLFGQDMGDQKNVTLVSELDAEMGTPVPWMENRRGAGVEIEAKEPGIYLVAATSMDKRIIQTSILEMQADGSVTPLQEGIGLTPYSFAAAGREAAGKLFVVVTDMSAADPANDPRPAGKVKIYVYRGVPAPEQGG